LEFSKEDKKIQEKLKYGLLRNDNFYQELKKRIIECKELSAELPGSLMDARNPCTDAKKCLICKPGINCTRHPSYTPKVNRLDDYKAQWL